MGGFYLWSYQILSPLFIINRIFVVAKIFRLSCVYFRHVMQASVTAHQFIHVHCLLHTTCHYFYIFCCKILVNWEFSELGRFLSCVCVGQAWDITMETACSYVCVGACVGMCCLGDSVPICVLIASSEAIGLRKVINISNIYITSSFLAGALLLQWLEFNADIANIVYKEQSVRNHFKYVVIVY